MEKLKMRQYPCIYACDGDGGEKLNIEIDLPGVKKEEIVLKFSEDSFSVMAHSDEVEYAGTYSTCCPVEPDKAVAKYVNDMLIVTVPYKEPHEEIDLNIE